MDSSQQNKKIIITDPHILEQKKLIFQKSFKYHNDNDGTKDKIIFISDFDYTLFNKYNYETGDKYTSSYGMYNQDVFGGNQETVIEARKKLHAYYLKFEEDISIDENIRKEKLLEWNVKALELMAHPKFTKESVKKMVELKYNDKFVNIKKNVSKFYEKLIELNMPIIIVSGGIKEIIIEFMQLLNIKGLNEYIKRGRLSFIANEILFDENTKKCIGYNKNVIYGFNKSEYVAKLVHEKYPNVENVMVFGDLDTDYKSIEKLNLDKNKNVIGVGFLYYYPNEVKDEKFKIDDNDSLEFFKKFFDVNLLMDEGYDYPIELLNIFIK
jgi:phosphoserine phosphatase